MSLQQRVSRIARSIEGALPQGLAKDFKSNIEAIIRSNLESLDLVTTEQLAVQKRILERAVKRIHDLEQRIAEFEAAANSNDAASSEEEKPE